MNTLPTDEEIQAYIDKQPYYGSCTQECNEGIEQGAKWMREHALKIFGSPRGKGR